MNAYDEGYAAHAQEVAPRIAALEAELRRHAAAVAMEQIDAGLGDETPGVRVAIAQVDGKWPNLALAKIAAWERSRGSDVELFNALFEYDLVYASKVFTDTPDDGYLPEKAWRAGSGYDLETALPYVIEAMRPDWSLWPAWPHDMGYSTRGCIRRCPFCVVPEKEGNLRVVAEFGDVWTGRDELILLDANLTAAPLDHFQKVCGEATSRGVALNFSQGLDARLLTDEHAEILRRTKTTKTIHMAFDHVRDEPAVRAAIATMQRAGWPASRLMFYVLIGFDSTHEENLYRVHLVRSLGADPFVMPFKRDDPYQRRFARWVNNKVAFKSMTWPEWLATFKSRIEVPEE